MWLLAGTGSAVILSYVSVTLSARLLGPANFGLLGALVSIASVATVVLSPLYTMAAHIAAVALVRQDVHAVRGLTAPTLVGTGALALLILAALLVWAEPINAFFHVSGSGTVALLAPLLAGLACIQVLKGFLAGLQRFRAFAAATALEALVRAALTGPLVLVFGVFGAVTSYLGGVVAADAWALGCLGKVGWRLPAWEQVPGPGWTAAGTALVTLVVAVLQYGDLVLLRWYASAEEVGMYAATGALGNTLFTLAVPLTLPAFPRALLAHQAGQPTWPILRRALAPVAVGGLVATFAAAWLGLSVASYVFGSPFQGVGPLLPPYLAKTTALIALALLGQHAVAVGRMGALGSGAALALAAPVVLTALHAQPYMAAMISFGIATGAATLVGVLLATPRG